MTVQKCTCFANILLLIRTRLIEIPYAPLVQDYQKCHYSVYQTLLNQAGIAVGNIQIVAPLCIAFLMIVTWLHKWWSKVPLDESYTKAEKDSALDAYAMSLLLARDDRLKTAGHKSVIAQIAEELSEHTMLSDMSHKSRASVYNMNLSSHSLRSNPDSPIGRIYKRIASLNSARIRSSAAAVTPSNNHHHQQQSDDEIPCIVLDVAPPNAKKYMTYEDEHASFKADLKMQMSRKQQCSDRVIELEAGWAGNNGSFNMVDESDRTRAL